MKVSYNNPKYFKTKILVVMQTQSHFHKKAFQKRKINAHFKMSVKEMEKNEKECKPTREKMQYNAKLPEEFFRVIKVSQSDWLRNRNFLTILEVCVCECII